LTTDVHEFMNPLMSASGNKFSSIVLLLQQPRKLDLDTVRKAAESAFCKTGQPVKIAEAKKAPGFHVFLGPMPLAVINFDQPYFRDVARAAESTPIFPARQAILQHKAWLSADFAADVPPGINGMEYNMLGKLIAAFMQEDVLGILRTPDGPIIGYHSSVIPFFAAGHANDIFRRASPDRGEK
jgi:hypothetical protein